ncbi:MAG: GC-type dockerin domain-anchored protein [Phycisphaerales bacterium]|nr:MAG: hypothetical protein IPK69_04755 [Phycisphaerales bacterium]
MILLFATLNSMACAQPQLRATSRAVSEAFGPGPGDVSADSGVLAVAPASAISSAMDNNVERGAFGMCLAECDADFSGFHFSASGTGETSGAGMFLTAFGTGSISDQITITSTTLPVGTPVMLRFTAATTGHATVTDQDPVVGVIASFGLCTSSFLSGFGSLSQTCASNVGATFTWSRTLNVTLSANRLSGNGPIMSGISADVHVLHTIEVLTPGALVSAQSGHNYAPPIVCIADVDNGTGTGTPDGGVTIDDLLYYIQIFNQGLVDADVDDGSGTGTHDGGVTIDDLLYYLTRFNAGC